MERAFAISYSKETLFSSQDFPGYIDAFRWNQKICAHIYAYTYGTDHDSEPSVNPTKETITVHHKLSKQNLNQ